MDAKFALQSFNDVDAAINRRIHKMKKGDTLQPFVLTVGPSKTNLKRSYCVVDNIKYDFTTLKTAFDTCFKAIFALQANYPSEAYNPWLFIQKALYEISTAYDIKNAEVSTTIGNFKQIVRIMERTSAVVNTEKAN